MAKYRMIAARVGSEHLNKDVDIDDHAPLDEQQRQINRLLGIGDDVFFKYSQEKRPGIIDECQRRVNELMGIKDDDFLACRSGDEKKDPTIDDTQRRVNELMGIDEATFRKYNK